VSNQPILISISEAASLLGLTKQQLYQLTRERSRVRQAQAIPVVRLGKRLAFRRESLVEWVASLEKAVR